MFQSKVKWTDKRGEHTNYGLVDGSTYREAVDRITGYFGEYNMTQLKMTPIGSEHLVIYKDGTQDLVHLFEDM